MNGRVVRVRGEGKVTHSVAKAEDGAESAASLTIPSNAEAITSIQLHSNWEADARLKHTWRVEGLDGIVNNPSHGGAARKFETHFSGSGGERYSDSFGEDTTATNFVYDGWVYIASNNLANMELDLNQVLGEWRCNDLLVPVLRLQRILGVRLQLRWQCPVGEAAALRVTRKTGLTNTWHHVQIAESRNGSGYITYHSITFDGVQHNIKKTVYGKFNLSRGAMFSKPTSRSTESARDRTPLTWTI